MITETSEKQGLEENYILHFKSGFIGQHKNTEFKKHSSRFSIFKEVYRRNNINKNSCCKSLIILFI